MQKREKGNTSSCRMFLVLKALQYIEKSVPAIIFPTLSHMERFIQAVSIKSRHWFKFVEVLKGRVLEENLLILRLTLLEPQ